MNRGIRVYCVVCQRQKKPHGRSAPMFSSMCDYECKGYECNPKVGCLWPAETEKDFGYPCCDVGTESC